MVVSGKNDQSVGGGGVNEDNLPDFSDPEDFVDDISNEGLDTLMLIYFAVCQYI